MQSIWGKTHYFWATICKTVCPMLSDHCPVCNVGVLWPNEWIKMKLGTEVALSRGHIVLDGDPPPAPKRGTAPNFRPMSAVAKRLMDQDATWYGGGPRPRQHCVRLGPSCPLKGHNPQFSAHVCCGQTADGSRCHLVSRWASVQATLG